MIALAAAIPAAAISVKDYGARGNGLTDDAAAIQAAFHAACATGEALRFPAGTYVFTSTLTTGCAMTMFGDGPWASVLVMTKPKSGRFGIVANYSLTVVGMAVNAFAAADLKQSPAIVRCDNTSASVCPSPPATGQVFVFERYWSSGWNFGLDIAGTAKSQVQQVTVRDCVISVVGSNDTIAEAVNVRSANFLTVADSILTGSGENDHLIYLIGVLKVTIENNIISNNWFQDSAIKMVGGGTNSYQDWTIENNTITHIGQAINLYQENAAMQPAVHIRGNVIIGVLDTNQTDAGAINLVAGPGTAFFKSVFIEDNYAENLTLGVITLSASPGSGYKDVYVHKNTFVNWSTLAPGMFVAIDTIGAGSFERLSAISLSLDGKNKGRAALNTSFSAVNVADLRQVNTTNPLQDRESGRNPGAVSELEMFTVDGVKQPTGHIVSGKVTLDSGKATVDFKDASAFSSANFSCSGADETASHLFTIRPVTRSRIEIDSTAASDTIAFICVGN